MNDKLRSVNTRFWDDPFVESLSPSEKLLFLYLLTNPQANLLGIYEITLKRIAYDTGLTKETISKGFERFGTVRKAFYTKDNFVILPNWLKNQRLNSNMRIAVVKEFKSLPNSLKNSILTNGSERLGNDSEGFRMVMESFGKYEIEIESEIEVEKEKEKISFDFVESCYKESFDNWIEYKKARKESYKNQKSLMACYNRLLKLADKDILKVKEIIDYSMASNYAGLFLPKQTGFIKSTERELIYKDPDDK